VSDEFDNIVEGSVGSKQPANSAASDLEKSNSCLKSAMLEERFLWVAVIILIIDILSFGSMETWAAPVTITVIELVILVIVAKKCEVAEVSQYLDKILNIKSGS